MKPNDNLLNRLKKHLPQDLYLETVQRFNQHSQTIDRCKRRLNSLKLSVQTFTGDLVTAEGQIQQLKSSESRIHNVIDSLEDELSKGDESRGHCKHEQSS